MWRDKHNQTPARGLILFAEGHLLLVPAQMLLISFLYSVNLFLICWIERHYYRNLESLCHVPITNETYLQNPNLNLILSLSCLCTHGSIHQTLKMSAKEWCQQQNGHRKCTNLHAVYIQIMQKLYEHVKKMFNSTESKKWYMNFKSYNTEQVFITVNSGKIYIVPHQWWM